MKIGIVCYPSLGGSGVVATELGHALAASGHEVHFITYELPFRLRIDNKNIFFHQVEINRYDLFKYPDYALPLAVKIATVAEEFALEYFGPEMQRKTLQFNVTSQGELKSGLRILNLE